MYLVTQATITKLNTLMGRKQQKAHTYICILGEEGWLSSLWLIDYKDNCPKAHRNTKSCTGASGTIPNNVSQLSLFSKEKIPSTVVRIRNWISTQL